MDDADYASDNYTAHCELSIAKTQRRAALIQPGTPGTCDICDTHVQRIVETEFKFSKVFACARCRDELKLK